MQRQNQLIDEKEKQKISFKNKKKEREIGGRGAFLRGEGAVRGPNKCFFSNGTNYKVVNNNIYI